MNYTEPEDLTQKHFNSLVQETRTITPGDWILSDGKDVQFVIQPSEDKQLTTWFKGLSLEQQVEVYNYIKTKLDNDK